MRRNRVVAAFMLAAATVLVAATPAHATTIAVKKVTENGGNALDDIHVFHELQITGKRRAVDLRITKSGRNCFAGQARRPDGLYWLSRAIDQGRDLRNS